jgi:hypothetical protein
MRRAARGSVYLVLTAVVVFVCLVLAFAAGKLTGDVCTATDDRRIDAAMVGVCVAAFFLGHFLVDKRDQSRDRYPDRPHETRPAKRGALIAHIALAAFFAAGVGALGYETVGVWSDNPWHFQPITHFVRCAKNANWQLTMLVAATVSFLVGHWLWFPQRKRG